MGQGVIAIFLSSDEGRPDLDFIQSWMSGQTRPDIPDIVVLLYTLPRTSYNALPLIENVLVLSNMKKQDGRGLVLSKTHDHA